MVIQSQNNIRKYRTKGHEQVLERPIFGAILDPPTYPNIGRH